MPDGLHRLPPSPVLNLPNAVTAFRLLAAAPATLLVLDGQLGPAFAVFAAAAASDGLDGWLARRYGGSRFGALLDPVADKALVAAAVLSLTWQGLLPAPVAALIVARDVLIVLGVLAIWACRLPVPVQAAGLGKVNTALQLLLIGATLAVHGFGLGVPGLLPALAWAVAASTVLSGALYVRRAVR